MIPAGRRFPGEQQRSGLSGDGRGVVSHAGMGLLRELADFMGLSSRVTGHGSRVTGHGSRPLWRITIVGRGSMPQVRCSPMAQTAWMGSDGRVVTVSMCSAQQRPRRRLWRLVDERIDAAHLPGVRCNCQKAGVGGRRCVVELNSLVTSI
jgi:hypothetical protein